MEEELSYRMESVPEDLMSTLYPFQVGKPANPQMVRWMGGWGGGGEVAAAVPPGDEGELAHGVREEMS